MPSQEENYISKISSLREQIAKKSKTLALVSFFRLLSFLAVPGSVYKLANGAEGYYYFILAAAIIGFFGFVRYSTEIQEQKRFLNALLFVYQNELGQLKGLPNEFADGKEFMALANYAADLDIFGPASLYHLLNRTTTSHGKKKLAERLAQPFLNPEQILYWQQAIKQLSSQSEICFRIGATGRVGGEMEGNLDEVQQWLEMPAKLSRLQWLKLFRFAFPPIAIAAFFYYLSSDNYIPLLISFAIAWIVTGRYKKYIDQQYLLLGKKNSILQQYARILQEFGGVDAGDSALLQQERQTAQETHKSIFRLSKLSGLFDQRNNILVNFFMNSFFLYDLQCAIALESWKEKHRANFTSWVDCVSNIELLTSLSAFARNHPDYSYSLLLKEGAMIRAEAMGHPLIRQESMVSNNLLPTGEKILLITGSNMAGKTTFLRAAGVNLVLAGTGAPVCASSFSFTPMQILSSIRIDDSLQEKTSYFMAELIRLKEIAESLENGIPSLILVDEILRGTNSDDKTFGSSQFIQKLLGFDCLALFATHDLSLGGLEDEFPGLICNYSFESIIENDQLSFDYTLRKGIARNKNASFLMRKMGIIPAGR